MSDNQAASAGRRKIWLQLLLLVAIYCAVQLLLPRPDTIKPEGWKLLGIFLAAIVGLMIEPLPGGAIVLMGVTAAALTGALPLEKALGGYANPVVWLVLAAFLASRALLKTGLARRVAFLFLRAFGRNSLGVSYSLILSDVTLATVIPSNAARAGGIILPIARSLAELYGSNPGATAALLGRTLMVAVYQGECIAAAMFLTGQASNPLAASFARSMANVEITWGDWLLAGIVPGALSLLVVPWIVHRLLPPAIRHTPEAADLARRELAAQGPLDRNQKILVVIFATMCGLWVAGKWIRLGITEVALLGISALLLTGVLTWEDAVSEKRAFDVFVWYGGILRMGEALNEYGVTKVFAERVGGFFGDLGWVPLMALALLIYFYAHYAFASITAHMFAMYPPFLALLMARGAPVGLVVYAFACLANLAAGLTHYGTTPAPMFYAHRYATFGEWWRTGFLISLVNLAIWCSAGFLWWRLIGIW